jgi:hypothetical protein
MVFIFILLLINLVVIWSDNRKTSVSLLLFNLVVGSALFLHHVTSTLDIQL